MGMNISEIREQALAAVRNASSFEDLQQLETSLLGKKGSVTGLLKAIREVPPEQRRQFGQDVNVLKNEIEKAVEERRGQLVIQSAERGVELDTSLPGAAPRRGTLHPIIQTMYALNDAFLSLGFEIFEAPEVSSELFAFDNLNFPSDHPARESMDTYWLKGYENKRGAGRLCLRPHLTGGSVRYMQQHRPPFRFVYPGRVYRNEATDAGHERAFFQYEALLVDRHVPFSAVRLMVNTILQRVFGRTVKTRMRAGFFPFVEPGFEIDMECLVCGGSGCSVCGHDGWLELMPGGPPHPNVFRAGGIDPAEWQGAYINIGLDRLVMMKHGIDDIRLFHSADLRFLKQF